MCTLSECYRDGLSSSQTIVTSILLHKFSSVGGSEMGFLLPMVSGSLRAVMLKCAQNYQQQQLMRQSDAQGGEEAWIQQVPQEDRERWKTTIERDQQRLQERYQEKKRKEIGHTEEKKEEKPSLAIPLSNAYLEGNKKKAKQNPAELTSASSSSSSSSSSSPADTRISDNFHRTLQRSIDSVISSTPTESISPFSALPAIPHQLDAEYQAQLIADMRSTINTQFRADYSADKFEAINKIMNQK